jgi:crotonobetainyl-CoA:carnitine CoA-transferase CaiB-like acyl-CoA transferase
VIAAGNDKLWKIVCDIVCLPHLVDDPRFKTQADRSKNQKELKEILQKVFDKHSADFWLNEFEKHGVPCAPINTFEEILSDPHVQHMGIVKNIELPNGVETKTVGFPILMSRHHFKIYRRPPKLGEHNTEVFSEWTDANKLIKP